MSSATRNQRAKRGTVIRLSLAALALAGIGAAATTAAWTDNVFFAAQASTSTFNLQGSIDGVTVVDNAANGSAVTINVPTEKFANLTPGETRTAEVTVHNTGNMAAALDAAALTATGPLFDKTIDQKPAVVTVALKSGSSSALAARTGTAVYTITVTTPADWSTAYQGKTAGSSISLQISGKSTN